MITFQASGMTSMLDLKKKEKKREVCDHDPNVCKKEYSGHHVRARIKSASGKS